MKIMKGLPLIVFALLLGLLVWGGSYAFKVYKITQATPVPIYDGKVTR